MEQSAIEFLSNLFTKLQIFFARPDVQTQLLIIAAILGLVWLASKAITFVIDRFVPAQASGDVSPKGEASSESDASPKGEASPKGDVPPVSAALSEDGAPSEGDAPADDQARAARRAKPVWQMIVPGLRLLVFPVLALIATNQVISYLLDRGAKVGLLELFEFILWVLFFYRLFLGFLYTVFEKESVRRFQVRLFAPLFFLFVAYTVLSLIVNVFGTARLILTDLFDNPLTVGSLFLATVGLYLWINAVWGINRVILGLATRTMSINEGRLEASLALMGYILIGLGVAAALSALGVSSAAFAAIAAGLSVGIGFGLREVLSNFISGILLLFEGSISPGDMVQVNDQRGIVEKLSVRATFVKMLDSTEVIVPNQDLLISPVTTFTGADRIWRIDVPVYVNYGYDIEEVRALLMEIAASCPNTVPEMPPRIFLVYVGDSGMRFKIWLWIDLTQVGGPEPAMDYIYTTASREFDRRGIEVPRPELAVFHHADEVPQAQTPALEEKSSEHVPHSSAA